MQRPSQQIANPSPFGRSRVTNGRMPAGIDARSPNARRFRGLVRAYETEFESTSEPDGSMINMAVTLKLEEMQGAQLHGPVRGRGRTHEAAPGARQAETEGGGNHHSAPIHPRSHRSAPRGG